MKWWSQQIFFAQKQVQSIAVAHLNGLEKFKAWEIFCHVWSEDLENVMSLCVSWHGDFLGFSTGFWLITKIPYKHHSSVGQLLVRTLVSTRLHHISKTNHSVLATTKCQVFIHCEISTTNARIILFRRISCLLKALHRLIIWGQGYQPAESHTAV